MADPTPELLIKEFLEEAGRDYQRNALQFHVSFKADRTESGRKILALSRQQQVQVLLYAVAHQVEAIRGRTLSSGIDLSSLLAALHVPVAAPAQTMASLELSGLIAAILRKELPLTDDDLCQLVGTITQKPGCFDRRMKPHSLGAGEDAFCKRNLYHRLTAGDRQPTVERL